MNALAKERIRSYRVGMAETDTRRHYYYQMYPAAYPDYCIRVCDWLAVNTPVVFMPEGIVADCKNCLRIKEIAKVRELERRVEQLEKAKVYHKKVLPEPYQIPRTRVIGKPLSGDWIPEVQG